MPILDQIKDFERYNIYVLPCFGINLSDLARKLEQENIPIINIGRCLAESLNNNRVSKHLHLEAEDEFKKTIGNNAMKFSINKPPVIAVFNLGILFEKTLSLDASKLIRELSKSFAIIIIWDEPIDSPEVLHWGIQKETFQLNFTDTHLKQLNISYEI